MSLRYDIYDMLTQMDADAIPQDSRTIKVPDVVAFSREFINESKNPFTVCDGIVTHVYGCPVVEDKSLGHPVAIVAGGAD